MDIKHILICSWTKNNIDCTFEDKDQEKSALPQQPELKKCPSWSVTSSYTTQFLVMGYYYSTNIRETCQQSACVL